MGGPKRVVGGTMKAVLLAVLVAVAHAQFTPSASNCFGRGDYESSHQYVDTRTPLSSSNSNTSQRPIIANGSCVCADPQYTGPECANVACPNNCGHSTINPHGECIQTAEHTSVCYCFETGSGGMVSHRRGSACELMPCIADCNGNGRCIGGQCECYPGFRGSACEETTCDCLHGTCGGGGLCACENGWTGPKCNLRICPFNCHATHGQGLCINGTCACQTGYIGDVCEHTICPNLCSLKGQCDRATGRCTCQPGYTGN